jgi:hypothetical protein
MVILKLAIIFIFILSFFWLFVFGPFYDHIPIQMVVFMAIIGWNILRFSVRETISVLKFCFPFVFSLFVFGLIFHFTQLLGRQDWLEDTLIKCLVCRFSWYLSTYPALKSGSKIKYTLKKYACLIIALYLYLYEEIENSNRLLRNRYQHLYEDHK